MQLGRVGNLKLEQGRMLDDFTHSSLEESDTGDSEMLIARCHLRFWTSCMYVVFFLWIDSQRLVAE